MIEKLRKEFPSLVLEKNLPANPDLECYRLSDGQYIGIPKNDLDEKNRSLLSIFLTPIEPGLNLTSLQALWQEVLHSKEATAFIELKKHYDLSLSMRFVHFFLQNEVDRTALEEALSFLSLSKNTVVWITSTSGVIIEEKHHDSISKREWIDWRNAIASDFYTDVYLYIGDYFNIEEYIQEQYDFESYCFQLTRQFNKSQTVLQSFGIMPYILLHDAKSKTRKGIERYILDATDEELHSIKTFIESGLNISLAAKTLFMHRNSLQYRVEKFIERTGIDIKSFQGALVVYLAILSKKL